MEMLFPIYTRMEMVILLFSLMHFNELNENI
jgi:hypothetical protein